MATYKPSRRSCPAPVWRVHQTSKSLLEKRQLSLPGTVGSGLHSFPLGLSLCGYSFCKARASCHSHSSSPSGGHSEGWGIYWGQKWVARNLSPWLKKKKKKNHGGKIFHHKRGAFTLQVIPSQESPLWGNPQTHVHTGVQGTSGESERTWAKLTAPPPGSSALSPSPNSPQCTIVLAPPTRYYNSFTGLPPPPPTGSVPTP